MEQVQEKKEWHKGLVLKRRIGEYSSGLPGPVVIIASCLHGNEPSGNIAISHVLKKLQENDIQIMGSFYGLTGNMDALELDQRYIDKDLNRIWKDDYVEAFYKYGSLTTPPFREFKELKGLYDEIHGITSGIKDEVFLVDLHTTSASSCPFFIMGDTIRNRKFASLLPIPVVLGVEEQIEGTMSTFLNELGFVAVNFEAGQHHDNQSVDRHEAAIWLSLVSSGCLTQDDVPDFADKVAMLQNRICDIPYVFESRFRYDIAKDEEFKMQPGFMNFAEVYKNQLLAHSNGFPVRAESDGLIFMPLYQSQGEDGFFIINRIPVFWIKVSAVIRRLKLDKLFILLPGVHRDRSAKQVYIVNKKVARFLTHQFFHLHGYRKIRETERKVIFVKRMYDFKTPSRIKFPNE
jgi:Succinylglutamate desuccinylase / Aspartoacylase family